jgi:hypothetical protein
MEKLARNENTPATEAAFEVLGRMPADEALDLRYPDGTVLIPADSPGAAKMVHAAVGERRPLALVFADGSDVLYSPPDGNLLTLALIALFVGVADWLRRKRDEPMFVPSTWVAEFHSPADRAPAPVG